MTLDNIFLYRITHIENIPHILKHGIVHASSPHSNPGFVPIGDSSLIDFRKTRQVHTRDGRLITLGDFIPFYFGLRMPMLYVIQHGGNCVEQARRPEDIVYVAVQLLGIISSRYEYYFSDGHATDFLTEFYTDSDIEQLPKIIDWQAVTARVWSGDGIETDIKRRKQAEFLVGNDIGPQHLAGFVCYNDKARDRLTGFGIEDTRIKVIPNAYY